MFSLLTFHFFRVPAAVAVVTAIGLRNNTIKDLHLRFDHEATMHEADKKLINAQWVLWGLVLLVGALTFYIYLRRKKEEAIEIEHQMLKEYPLSKNKKVMLKCFKYLVL